VHFFAKTICFKKFQGREAESLNWQKLNLNPYKNKIYFINRQHYTLPPYLFGSVIELNNLFLLTIEKEQFLTWGSLNNFLDTINIRALENWVRTALGADLLVLILPTFYEHLFVQKCFCCFSLIAVWL